MGILVDSHCHLHDREFFSEKQAEEMLVRAHKKGVEKIICIGTDPADSLAARDFAKKHEDVFWTYGIHPSEAGKNKEGDEFSLLEIISNTRPTENKSNTKNNKSKPGKSEMTLRNSLRLVGIGEVGLDYHYGSEKRIEQIKLFEQMLELGVKNDLPFSFHIREAFDDFFGVIANFPKLKGVVHSFSDNKKNLKRILTETDFYVGVNGMTTYSTLPTPPLNRILLETDAPFLTPKPFRGIINEPGHIEEISLWLSEKLSINIDEIRKETTKNVKQLFHI